MDDRQRQFAQLATALNQYASSGSGGERGGPRDNRNAATDGRSSTGSTSSGSSSNSSGNAAAAALWGDLSRAFQFNYSSFSSGSGWPPPSHQGGSDFHRYGGYSGYNNDGAASDNRNSTLEPRTESRRVPSKGETKATPPLPPELIPSGLRPPPPNPTPPKSSSMSPVRDTSPSGGLTPPHIERDNQYGSSLYASEKSHHPDIRGNDLGGGRSGSESEGDHRVRHKRKQDQPRRQTVIYPNTGHSINLGVHHQSIAGPGGCRVSSASADSSSEDSEEYDALLSRPTDVPSVEALRNSSPVLPLASGDPSTNPLPISQAMSHALSHPFLAAHLNTSHNSLLDRNINKQVDPLPPQYSNNFDTPTSQFINKEHQPHYKEYEHSSHNNMHYHQQTHYQNDGDSKSVANVTSYTKNARDHTSYYRNDGEDIDYNSLSEHLQHIPKEALSKTFPTEQYGISEHHYKESHEGSSYPVSQERSSVKEFNGENNTKTHHYADGRTSTKSPVHDKVQKDRNEESSFEYGCRDLVENREETSSHDHNSSQSDGVGGGSSSKLSQSPNFHSNTVSADNNNEESSLHKSVISSNCENKNKCSPVTLESTVCCSSSLYGSNTSLSLVDTTNTSSSNVQRPSIQNANSSSDSTIAKIFPEPNKSADSSIPKESEIESPHEEAQNSSFSSTENEKEKTEAGKEIEKCSGDSPSENVKEKVSNVKTPSENQVVERLVNGVSSPLLDANSSKEVSVENSQNIEDSSNKENAELFNGSLERLMSPSKKGKRRTEMEMVEETLVDLQNDNKRRTRQKRPVSYVEDETDPVLETNEDMYPLLSPAKKKGKRSKDKLDELTEEASASFNDMKTSSTDASSYQNEGKSAMDNWSNRRSGKVRDLLKIVTCINM
ncbi:hypothetical protein Anas_13043, partial [Armadillidium nasatum]